MKVDNTHTIVIIIFMILYNVHSSLLLSRIYLPNIYFEENIDKELIWNHTYYLTIYFLAKMTEFVTLETCFKFVMI